nr:hypothetical protein [Nanoarchaeum sp.]
MLSLQGRLIKLFKGKKGLESNIVVAIIIIVSAVILLIAVKLITDIGNDAVDREACRTSVLLKEKSKLLGTNPLVDKLNCETNLVDVNSKDEIEIKKIISEEMYDCWYQFDEGKRDFLDTWDFGKGDNYCFVCSRIDFSKETQEEISSFGDLSTYLNTQAIPLKGQTTFFEYFYGDDYNPASYQSIEENYPTNKPMYVVFFADKRQGIDFGGATSGLAAGLLCVGGIALSPFTMGLSGAIVCTSVVGVAGEAYISTHKNTFINGLYVGNDEKIIEVCQQ